MKIDDIRFDDNGLITAVVQDVNTKEVLMVAYMNQEALEPND
jgi:phosphoribosyl-AMP cyclohydrolase / phosphoribosyl-ATP pyrophosphohydrolase